MRKKIEEKKKKEQRSSYFMLERCVASWLRFVLGLLRLFC